jgi:hypothetical protein
MIPDEEGMWFCVVSMEWEAFKQGRMALCLLDVATRINGRHFNQHTMKFAQIEKGSKPLETSLLISMAGNGAVAVTGLSIGAGMGNPRLLEIDL